MEIALDKIAKALGLKDDADEAAVIETLGAIKDRAEQARETETLLSALGNALDIEKLAEKDNPTNALLAAIDTLKPKGDYVTIAATKLAELNAARDERDELKTAKADLDKMRFDVAFDKAMSDGRAAPANKDQLRAMFDKQPEDTLTLLENLPPLVNVKRQGPNGEAGDAPDGVDPERYDLDQRAQAYAREHKVTYLEALEHINAEKAAA